MLITELPTREIIKGNVERLALSARARQDYMIADAVLDFIRRLFFGRSPNPAGIRYVAMALARTF